MTRLRPRRFRTRARYIPRRTMLQSGLTGLATLMAKPLIVGCSDDSSAGGGAGAGTGGSGGGSAGQAGAGQGGAAGAGGGGGTGGFNPDPGFNLTSNIADIGPLGDADANGVKLPDGFTSRVLAESGKEVIAGGGFNWHVFPDGGATFAAVDGGWVYVSNSEMILAGGVGALRFDSEGSLVDAYEILSGSSINCGGGATPWGTWLSCEEAPQGKVFECDPFGETNAVERLALGVFKHEAVAVDLVKHHLYLTEDESDGNFYRFTPDAMTSDGFADLTAGVLEVAEVGMNDSVTWHPLPDPRFTMGTATRKQVAAATVFRGGEGIWFYEGVVYFSTKGDNRVWAYDTNTATMGVLYDAATAADPILTGVDNLTGSCCGDILVAEDNGDMQIVAILPDGSLKPLLQVMGQDSSEIAGPAFDPSGTRLYFSSQRGVAGSGLTYEVTGPFHT